MSPGSVEHPQRDPPATLGALAGRRVLELADAKGMYCGKLLADMGADVIKIERPGGDATRAIPPHRLDPSAPDTAGDRSLFFLYMNTSKRGLTLDITRPAGRTLFARLARTADIVVETFAPDHLASLGLGYETLREARPGLVFTSITDFGQTGPHRHHAGSDLVAGARGGAMYVTGDPDDPPVALAGSQSYVMAATCAAAASLIALYRATLDGTGQHVDISVQETTVAVSHVCGVGKWLDDGIVPRRGGTGLFASVPSGAYPCRDGLVYLMVNRPLHWQALARWIHEVTGTAAVLDPLFDGPSSNRLPYRDLLDVYITDLTQRFTVDEIYREGQRRHLAFTPVNTASAVAADPHLAARGYFVDVDHGEATLSFPGAPYRHAATPWRISRRAPHAGEHTREILGGELGLAPAELARLEAEGIV
jgi:crotonobetainyl-CoA:carnitine CoA-transferase CaiB-like acyl-CoA transferase